MLTTIALISTTTTAATAAARVRRRERYSARPVDTGAGGHRTTGSRFGWRRLGGPRPAHRARRRPSTTIAGPAGWRAGGGDATTIVVLARWGDAHILITGRGGGRRRCGVGARGPRRGIWNNASEREANTHLGRYCRPSTTTRRTPQ